MPMHGQLWAWDAVDLARAIRTRAIEKRLKDVETSEDEDAVNTLHLIAVNDD